MISDEVYISVDIETSGPIPGEFSLLSIGACLIHQPSTSIYIELKPSGLKHDPEALAVSGLNLNMLEREGVPPQEAMRKFDKWITSLCSTEQKVVFVGLNAPFDWSFINYYFHKYIGRNPFGFTAIDIKAYFMGATGCDWQGTKSSRMAAILKPNSTPSHNALDDARFQAELFMQMLKYRHGCDQNLQKPT